MGSNFIIQGISCFPRNLAVEKMRLTQGCVLYSVEYGCIRMYIYVHGLWACGVVVSMFDFHWV